MTIEIHKPELEALIQQRMAGDHFLSIEDILLQALQSLPANTASSPEQAQTLEEMFAKIRGLADDLDFSRDPSPGRPVNLP